MMLNQPLHEKADLLVENNQLPEARDIYEHLCELDPSDVDAWSMSGSINIELGQLDSATEQLHQALSLDPHCSIANYGLATIHAQLNQFDDAFKYCERAVDHDPEFAEAWLLMGMLQSRRGHYAESETSSRKVLSLLPGNAEAQMQLASALRAQSKTEAAIECFTSVLHTHPNLAFAHQELGLLFRLNGNPERAAEHLDRALQIEPDNPAIYDELAAVYVDQGQLGMAEAVARKAVQLAANHPTTHNSLGFVLHTEGKEQEALKSFQEASRLDPDYVAPVRNLAAINWLLGRPEEALNYSLKLVQLEPRVLQNRQQFVQVLSSAMPGVASEELLTQIEQCFGVEGLDLHEIVKPVTKLLLSGTELRELIAVIRRGANNDVYDEIVYGRFSGIFQNELLRLLMTYNVLTDIDFELLSAALRKALLRAAISGEHLAEGAENRLSFAIALACQFFNSEYVCLQDSDEAPMVDSLSELLKISLDRGVGGDPRFELGLAVLGMYGPLHTYDWMRPLFESDQHCLSAGFDVLAKRQWQDYFKESNIKRDMAAIIESDDEISHAVRAQYEESPYPRWLTVGLYSPRPYQDILREKFESYRYLDSGSFPVRVLNAGCGTGHHAIMSATRYSNSEVLAIDLSLSSLAYARRNANELGLDNITFRQMDILKLDSMEEKFHIIECGGVLHHIADTQAALKILVDLLHPGGVIMVGLYSEIARSNVRQCVEFIKSSGFRKTLGDIREARRAIISLDDSRSERRVLQSPDFYSLSACRDLLFHEHEHSYQLPAVAELLQECGLNFLGFDLNDPEVTNSYRAQFTDDPGSTNLQNWDQFERQHPRTFARMYNIWCQKVEAC